MQNEAEKYFPELKESEEERIRKALITFFKHFPYGDIVSAGTNVKEAITWLEKQSESDEIRAKMFLINKGYPIDTNGIFPTYKEMYNIIREGLEKQDK